MIGGLIKATGIVELESINQALTERFSEKIAELNMKVVEKAFEETRGEKV